MLRSSGINNLVVPTTLRVDLDCKLPTTFKTNSQQKGQQKGALAFSKSYVVYRYPIYLFFNSLVTRSLCQSCFKFQVIAKGREGEECINIVFNLMSMRFSSLLSTWLME